MNSCIFRLCLCYQLKKPHSGIREILDGKASGLTYTNDKGCDIGPHNDHVWRGFIMTRSHMKPFRNAGWPLFDKMDEIIPAKTSGRHVYNASQVSDADTTQASQSSTSTDNPDESSLDPTQSESPSTASQQSPAPEDSEQLEDTSSIEETATQVMSL
jgi:hypothetical protein